MLPAVDVLQRKVRGVLLCYFNTVEPQAKGASSTRAQLRRHLDIPSVVADGTIGGWASDKQLILFFWPCGLGTLRAIGRGGRRCGLEAYGSVLRELFQVHHFGAGAGDIAKEHGAIGENGLVNGAG